MKHWLFCLLLGMILWILPATARADARMPELLRVQIIANSNDPGDQQLKLQVRDHVLPLMQETLANCQDADKVLRIAQRHSSQWEWAAHRVLSKAGSEQDVRAEIGEFVFQDRVADGVLVPGGTYRTLRITLGAGEGKNWWGVLYPNLCQWNRNPQENGSVTFYSHTLTLLKKLFGGDWA